MRSINRMSVTASYALTLGLALALAGGGACSSSPRAESDLRSGLPPQAERVTSGSGGGTFTPDAPGRVFVYDAREQRVVGRYQVRSGQRLAVDGRSGRATIDGNEVRAGDLDGGREYEVYFRPDQR